MTVLLGSAGSIQVKRQGEGDLFSVLDTGDISAVEKRFSFDMPNGTFVTGDRVTIARIEADGSLSSSVLDFVAPTGWPDGAQHSDGSWYVHVDALGGFRLYRTWPDSLAGGSKKAVVLQAPASTYRIRVSIANIDMRCIGQVLDYSLETDRTAISITGLGDAFAQYESGMVSASGQMRCLWDWAASKCASTDIERAQYFHQLILRQQIGSEFFARFILRGRSAQPLDGTWANKAEIAYEGTCVVTEVGFECSPTEPLETRISFLVAGELQLQTIAEGSGDLLAEDGGYINTEDGDRIAD